MITRVLTLCCLLLGVSLLRGQPISTEANEVDAVTRQAAGLEAELTRLNVASPEAADVLLKLIDLYHSHARPFGLVQAGQAFVSHHTSHPRHRDAMRKLMDGLIVVGRNTELIAASRQFLARYPNDPDAATIERWLSRLLKRTGDVAGSAAVNESRWKRLGPNEEGRRAGREAVTQYLTLNTPVALEKAANLAQDMLNRLPPGEPALAAGLAAIDAFERRSDWAKAALVGVKVVEKSPPSNPYHRQQLLARVAENYSRLGQRANAVVYFKKAVEVADVTPRPELMARLINELHLTAPKPHEIEPIVQDYVKKYPDRLDRYSLLTLVAHSCFNAKELDKAAGILEQVLPHDARSNNAVSLYLMCLGAEPAKLASGEKALQDALNKSSSATNAAAIRYALFELYRDRFKDISKAKSAAEDLVLKYPVNDPGTASAANWLLDSATDDTDFQRIANAMSQSCLKHPWVVNLRNVLTNWQRVKASLKDKNFATRLKTIREAITQVDADPQVVAWGMYTRSIADNAAATSIASHRVKLMTAELLKTYPDHVAEDLFSQQVLFLRGQGAQKASAAVGLAKQWVERMPRSVNAALALLNAATDLGAVTDYPTAIESILRFEPMRGMDIGRRLLLAASAAKTTDLAKKAWAWVEAAYKRYGYDGLYATNMGDSLSSLGLKDEARRCWQRCVEQGNEDSSDFRDSAWRILLSLPDAEKVVMLDALLKRDSAWRFNFAAARADAHIKARATDAAIHLIQEAYERQVDRAMGGPTVVATEWSTLQSWITQYRADPKLPVADKQKLFSLVRDMGVPRAAMTATAALMEILLEKDSLTPMERLVRLGEAPQLGYSDAADYDMLLPFVQAAMARKDYLAASTLTSGMLANFSAIDDARRKTARDILANAYTRLGAAAGALIDEASPIAPLLQAALQLRLGDTKLAFETYLAHRKLFDEHRTVVPVDLLAFVCEHYIAAGGDDNHNRVEDILRDWIIKNDASKEIDTVDKARVQLLLARNYFRSKRYDLARAEFTTLVNKFKDTPQAVEAEFGIGETFMEQKVYDQAEQTFERLAGRRERDIVIRAEFLRGVLANRRGDRDEARAIFRSVLERVPNVELANQALFNLSEVYGAEQRYVDQLELLRTIGRLGRASKRWHTPGEPLSIVVQDSDLGVSRGHSRIPVKVTTEPGGDEELIYLLSGGAGKGLFRADLETTLGPALKGDRVLQLTGRDVIRVDYPDDFKRDFQNVQLPESEIRIAADATLEIASSKIVDDSEETLSQQLARELTETDQPKAAIRPKNQVRPGNLIYLRVKDADSDVSDDRDTVQVKLTAASGDSLTVTLRETGPHTGVFEGTCPTGDLPAAALATNTALDSSPLMAIDKDTNTAWLSEPDGATPKTLTADMKELKQVDHVMVSTPQPDNHAPVRMTLEGSSDGRIWYRLASTPAEQPVPPLDWPAGPMTTRVFSGIRANTINTWADVLTLAKSAQVESETTTKELLWERPADEKQRRVHAVLWHGKLVQPKDAAVRMLVLGDQTALMIDGRLELPVGRGGRSADLFLTRGTHDLTIFALANPNTNVLEARWTGDEGPNQLILHPFQESDFDLTRADARPSAPRQIGQAQANQQGTSWEFRFPPATVRYVRIVIHEYKGSAVAINHVVISDSQANITHLPTDADLLSLANNQVLEIAGGDAVTAVYVDDLNTTGSSRLLNAKLIATYHNGSISPIAHFFTRSPSGQVSINSQPLLRIDPGDRIIAEVRDFDMDQTNERDSVKIRVAINDGPPIELEAIETEASTGVFHKEIDTSDQPIDGKLQVKPGDRISLRYRDAQNTDFGHAVERESVVYVNTPTSASIRVYETRAYRPKGLLGDAPPRPVFLPPRDPGSTAGVALEVPLTVEVIDPDAAKNGASTVVVALTTTDGAQVDVECVISQHRLDGIHKDPNDKNSRRPIRSDALLEGRFTGQVIMQLGNKNSPAEVPLTANMPRRLIGGPKIEGPPQDPNRPEFAMTARVLNLSGADVVTASYNDQRRPDEPAQTITATARLLTDGKLSVTDADYQKTISAVHVGERLFLKVEDPDQDRTPERDVVKILAVTDRGEKEMLELVETLSHSGVFTASIPLVPAAQPTPGNLKPNQPELEVYFGDTIKIEYADDRAATADGVYLSTATINVVVGTDGKIQAFSKSFTDENLAVETQFHIAESHFELFKSHKALGRMDEAKADLESGRRILRELMEDYPNPRYAPRIAYLFAQFAQELGQYPEAIQAYQLIVKQYPEHTLAPDAQYKLAQCHEEAKNFEQALEEYVTLAATYPQHPLIANVMIAISDHFYKAENYKVAAQVGEKFLEKFEGHKWSAKVAFRVGQCYYKDKQFAQAGKAFDRFAKEFPDDPLCADALFWAGESYREANNVRDAFWRYNDCRIKFPATEAAKYSRGRLALPEMLRQFETEAVSLERESSKK